MSVRYEDELADTLEVEQVKRGPSKLTLARVAEIRNEVFRRVRDSMCEESPIDLDEHAACITLVVNGARAK